MPGDFTTIKPTKRALAPWWRCEGCHRFYASRTPHERWTGIYEGDFFSFRMCACCRDALNRRRQELWDWDGEWSSGEVDPFPGEVRDGQVSLVKWGPHRRERRARRIAIVRAHFYGRDKGSVTLDIPQVAGNPAAIPQEI